MNALNLEALLKVTDDEPKQGQRVLVYKKRTNELVDAICDETWQGGFVETGRSNSTGPVLGWLPHPLVQQ